MLPIFYTGIMVFIPIICYAETDEIIKYKQSGTLFDYRAQPD